MDTLRTCLEIDLDALTENYRTACSLTESLVTCVLKANAYGHGAPAVAQALQKAGCASFAVSCAREALELRRAGIRGEILVMGAPEPGYLARLIAEEITLTVCSPEDLAAVDRAAEGTGRTALVHLKADTGFHRLGMPCTEETARAVARAAESLRHTRIEGLFSHLGLVSRERDEKQHSLLIRLRDALRAERLSVPQLHLCDSIGLVRYPQWHYSRCRVGAFLYGVRPSRSEHMPFACRETIQLKCLVARVHQVPAGEVVGYDESGGTERPIRVATLCAGYGDGYPRCLSGGRGQALIRGRRAPVIGLVCMDQMMVDVTDIPEARAGDTATLLGGGIPYQEYADWAQTNRNECLTILSRRPVRLYRQGGAVVRVADELTGEELEGFDEIP